MGKTAVLGIPGTEALELRYASEHGARFLQMYAIRVGGANGQDLVKAWTEVAYPDDVTDVTVDEQTFGGKAVTVIHSPSAGARLGTYYSYSAEDTLLVVQAFDPAVAAEALAALP